MSGYSYRMDRKALTSMRKALKDKFHHDVLSLGNHQFYFITITQGKLNYTGYDRDPIYRFRKTMLRQANRLIPRSAKGRINISHIAFVQDADDWIARKHIHGIIAVPDHLVARFEKDNFRPGFGFIEREWMSIGRLSYVEISKLPDYKDYDSVFEYSTRHWDEYKEGRSFDQDPLFDVRVRLPQLQKGMKETLNLALRPSSTPSHLNRFTQYIHWLKSKQMTLYRVRINRRTSREAFSLWRSFENLVRWINDRMGTEAVRLFPTTEEAKGTYEVALLVEPNAFDQFEALVPEIRSRIRSRLRCKRVNMEQMEQAEPSYPLPAAQKSTNGWTVRGVEMVDILPPD